jgi:hypothetical protein
MTTFLHSFGGLLAYLGLPCLFVLLLLTLAKISDLTWKKRYRRKLFRSQAFTR